MRKIITAATTAGIASLSTVTATALTVEATLLSAQEAAQLLHANAKAWREDGEADIKLKRIMRQAEREIEHLERLTELYADLGKKLEADPMKQEIYSKLRTQLSDAGYHTLSDAQAGLKAAA